MSKHLSQIYLLAQVSTCCLAYVLCVIVCLWMCVSETQKEFALSESFQGTYLKSPCCWYIQLFDLLSVRERGRQKDRPYLAFAKMQHYADDWSVFSFSASLTVHNTELGGKIIQRQGDFLRENDSPWFGQFIGKSSLVHVILMPHQLLEPFQVIDFHRYCLCIVDSIPLIKEWVKNTCSSLFLEVIFFVYKHNSYFTKITKILGH